MAMGTRPVIAARAKVQASRRSSYNNFGDLRSNAKQRRVRQGLFIAASLSGLMLLVVVFAKILGE
jgi:hypothetical protein